jgi:tetratricopeptide (TPR) repeat protein
MNNQQMSGKDFHKRAERAREHGSFNEALNLCELAFEIYAREKNETGMSEVCASSFLSLRHLSEKYSDDKSYLIRAKHAAEAGVEIARNFGKKEALSLPVYNLAQANFSLGEYKIAVKLFKEAIKTLPDSPHDSPSLLANMTIHLEVASYKNGDRKSHGRALKALEELENSEQLKYEKDTWVSGGYMKIAEVIYRDESKQAKEYLKKAGEIIEANPELILRKGQLDRLLKKLS